MKDQGPTRNQLAEIQRQRLPRKEMHLYRVRGEGIQHHEVERAVVRSCKRLMTGVNNGRSEAADRESDDCPAPRGKIRYTCSLHLDRPLFMFSASGIVVIRSKQRVAVWLDT